MVHVTESPALGHSSGSTSATVKRTPGWEKAYDYNLKMREWILKKLSKEAELIKMEEAAARGKKELRAYQAPIFKQSKTCLIYQSKRETSTLKFKLSFPN